MPISIHNILFRHISDHMSQLFINDPSKIRGAILGRQAWEGLIHNSNTVRVSNAENISHIQAYLTACELGMLELVESGSRSEQTYKFLLKTFQEYCAGHYLASLADKSTEILTSCITQLDRECFLNLQRVLLFASAASKSACQGILLRIVDFYQTGDINIATTRPEQHVTNDIDDLICLALQCNMECDSQGQFNSILEKLLPPRCINFPGVPSMPSISYFFRHLAPDAKMESISVRLDKCSTCSYNTFPVHVPTETNLLEAIEDGIQKASSTSESPRASPNTIHFDVYEFFAALRFTQLMSLVLNNVHLHGYINDFMKLIKDGYLNLLVKIEFCHAHLTELDLKEMTPLGTLQRLRTLNLSRNKAGRGLLTLVNVLKGKSTIEELDFSHMEAPFYVTYYIIHKLCRSHQLISLKLHGNGVNEASGEILVSALSSPMWCLLKSLNVSVCTLPNSIIATLTKTIGDLKQLYDLQIFDSLDAEFLLRQMVDVIYSHAKLKTLLLGSNLDLKDDDMNPVSSSTWTLFAETLHSKSNVRSLTLVGIQLHAVDLQRSLHLFKRQCYRQFG